MKKICSRATNEQGNDAACTGTGKGGEEVDTKGGVGLTVEGDGVENPLKKPGEKGPDGVAGGMGDAKKVGGDNEFSGIFEADGGL